MRLTHLVAATAAVLAFHGAREVDHQSSGADNGVTAIQFFLGADSPAVQIDRVVVRVCRLKPSSAQPAYCGESAEYRVVSLHHR